MIKNKISFCAVVKDDISSLKRMIESLGDSFSDIVIVDTGSNQEAKDYLMKHATQFFEKKWENDFATLRNFATEKAKNEWIFTLDSDEAASDALIKALPSIILPNDADGYKLPRIHYAGEKVPMRDYWKQLRLYRKSARYVGSVHESIKNLEKVKEIDDFNLAILHYNSRSYQKEKSLKYSQYLRDKIKETIDAKNTQMQEYYEYKLWVQDNVYFLETDPDVDPKILQLRYKEYERRKKEIDLKIKQEHWRFI